MKRNLIQRCITRKVIELNPYCPSCLSALHPHERIPQQFITKYLLFWISFKRFKCSKCGATSSFAYPRLNSRQFIPSADIMEDSSQFEIRLALPGFSRSDLSITLRRNMLAVSGAHNRDLEGFSRIYLWENVYGSFSRYFTLPDNIDRESITAVLKDGLLRIHLLKRKIFPEGNQVKIDIVIN